MSLIDRKLAKDTNVPSNDTISRQAAIDKINERQRKLIYCFGFENDVVKMMDIAKSIITAMPSAQSDIIRCRDCRWRKDQSGSTAWLPCRSLVTPDEFYCGRAERRTDE